MILSEKEALEAVKAVAIGADPGCVVFVGAREFAAAQQKMEATIVVQTHVNNHEMIRDLVAFSTERKEDYRVSKSSVMQLQDVPIDLIEVTAQIAIRL